MLQDLAALAAVCTHCRLSEGRTNVVFGSGSSVADVMIVGEGPGQQEDEQGVPFVGRSGQLLEKLLAEIDLDRSDVYIANVVKCRPPRNRDPRPDEIGSCKPYLRRQIELISHSATSRQSCSCPRRPGSHACVARRIRGGGGISSRHSTQRPPCGAPRG
ncbi:MAG: hypothetical protein GWP18_03445 [Proteobacteria bacterium]|nr:hypothetical protein [Pseudomonadota bacterium]